MTLAERYVGVRKKKSCPDPDAVHVCAVSYLMSDWSRELGLTCAEQFMCLQSAKLLGLCLLRSLLFQAPSLKVQAPSVRVYKQVKKGEAENKVFQHWFQNISFVEVMSAWLAGAAGCVNQEN